MAEIIRNPRILAMSALQHKYMIGAFNVFNLDTATAVLEAANREQSPVILQISMGARKYIPDLELFVKLLKQMIEYYQVSAFIQHDHCSDPESCREAIEAGVAAVMFDGSHLAYKENVAKTKQVVTLAARSGCYVEAELGCLPGFEDLVFAEKAEFTDPIQAKRFVEETGCFSLAVSVGTSHGGVMAENSLEINYQILAEIHRMLPDIPLVLHGGASLPADLVQAVNDQGGAVEYLKNASEESIRGCAGYGVYKVNMDVDNFLAYTAAVRESLNKQPEKYDPRKYLAEGRHAFADQVQHKMKQVLLSSGMAD